MKNLVSIIIPAYNIGELIRKTIDSVLEQTYTDFELIVVDDGSSDNTAEVVKSIRDERIKYFHQPNSGLPAKPRIKGVELSKGEYVAFLDHDDLWLPQKLEKQIAVITKDTSIGLVATNAYFLDDNKRTTLPLIRGLKEGYFSDSNLFPDNKVVQSTVLINKKYYLDVGGLRDDKELKAVEDYDLWIRIYKKYPCFYIDDSLVYYRRLVNSASGNNIQRYERVINYFHEHFRSHRLPKKINDLTIATLTRRLALAQFIEKNEDWRINIRKSFAISKNVASLMLYLLSYLPKSIVDRLHLFKKYFGFIKRNGKS